MIRISPSYLAVRFLAVIYSVLVSLYFGSLYTNGDQVFYTKWYRAFAGTDLPEAYTYFSDQVNPFEVFYFFVTWFGASLLDKLYFDMLINVCLILAFVSLLKKLTINPFVAVTVILTSFYLPVLMLAAERLKFGFLAGFLLLIVAHRYSRFFWGFFTVAGHVQMVIPLSALALAVTVTLGRIKRVSFGWYTFFFVGGGLLLINSTVGLSSLFDFATYKFNSYVTLDPFEIVKPFVFYILSLYCAWSKKKFVSIFFVSLFFAAFVFGSDRITILAYFAFMFFSAYKNHGLNLANFVVAPYMALKSIVFFGNIIDSGSGF